MNIVCYERGLLSVAYADNFRGKFHLGESAEGKTILGGAGVMPPGKFCKITPKYTHFCAFWK